MTSNKEKQNNIYLSLLPFKKTFQTIVTNILYSFEYKEKNINKFLEPQISFFYRELVREVSKELNITEKSIWNHLRFFLKGGKALNKLLNKIGNENLNSIVYSTQELLENKLCFMDQECIEGSNTDYDFTLLIKDEDYFPDQDPDQTLAVIIITLLQEITHKLNSNSEFNIFVEKFVEYLNRKSILNNIYNSFKGVIEEIKKVIKNGEEEDYILNYYKLKILQIDNFIKFLKGKITRGEDFFLSASVKTTFSVIPISVKFGQDISTFFLYRLKLFIDVDYPFKKLNRDIKDYLQGKFDTFAIPFDNIFGELIDISVVTGNNNVFNGLWNSTEAEYMLQPIKIFERDENLSDVIQLQEKGKLFTYPVASLKYQLKDVITIFNVDNPIKLKKRCQRFIEYLKMLCYAEDIPDPFYVMISQELKEQLLREQEEKKNDTYCADLIKILRLLGKEENNKYIITRESLKEIFPKDFCGELISGEFKDKEKIVQKILKHVTKHNKKLRDIIIDNNIDNEIRDEMIKKLDDNKMMEKIFLKLNYKSLKILQNLFDDFTVFAKLCMNIFQLDLIDRIIPIEINLLT